MKQPASSFNLYGDTGRYGTKSFGVNVSAERLDWLDLRTLEYVIRCAGAPINGLDLGCGLGTPSLAFGIAGARMHLIDIEDLSHRFEMLAAEIPIAGLRFTRQDLNTINASVLGGEYRFCYSQRTIHYLQFADAVNLLRLVASRMEPGAPLWLSASGAESELGEGYQARHQPLESRFGRLASAMAQKHQIFAPLCLYSEPDLIRLGETSGFKPVELKKSAFGNIKGIFEKC
jgi:hypothetical protein